MKNPKHSKALTEWVAAEKRLVASEREISATFLENMFGPQSQAEPPRSRPTVNVTPPKQPPNK